MPFLVVDADIRSKQVKKAQNLPKDVAPAAATNKFQKYQTHENAPTRGIFYLRTELNNKPIIPNPPSMMIGSSGGVRPEDGLFVLVSPKIVAFVGTSATALGGYVNVGSTVISVIACASDSSLTVGTLKTLEFAVAV